MEGVQVIKYHIYFNIELREGIATEYDAIPLVYDILYCVDIF